MVARPLKAFNGVKIQNFCTENVPWLFVCVKIASCLHPGQIVRSPALSSELNKTGTLPPYKLAWIS